MINKLFCKEKIVVLAISMILFFIGGCGVFSSGEGGGVLDDLNPEVTPQDVVPNDTPITPIDSQTVKKNGLYAYIHQFFEKDEYKRQIVVKKIDGSWSKKFDFFDKDKPISAVLLPAAEKVAYINYHYNAETAEEYYDIFVINIESGEKERWTNDVVI